MVKCVVNHCKNDAFIRFPHPTSSVFHKWLEVLGDKELKNLDPEAIYTDKRICHTHFNRQSRRKLDKAVPTLHLTQDVVQKKLKEVVREEEPEEEVLAISLQRRPRSQSIAVESVCRTCLAKNAAYNLFLSMYKGYSLIYLMEDHLNIKIRKCDGISSNICNNCVNKIQDFYNFTRQVQSAEMTLQSLKEEMRSIEEKERIKNPPVIIEYVKPLYDTDEKSYLCEEAVLRKDLHSITSGDDDVEEKPAYDDKCEELGEEIVSENNLVVVENDQEMLAPVEDEEIEESIQNEQVFEEHTMDHSVIQGDKIEVGANVDYDVAIKENILYNVHASEQHVHTDFNDLHIGQEIEVIATSPKQVEVESPGCDCCRTPEYDSEMVEDTKQMRRSKSKEWKCKALQDLADEEKKFQLLEKDHTDIADVYLMEMLEKYKFRQYDEGTNTIVGFFALQKNGKSNTGQLQEVFGVTKRKLAQEIDDDPTVIFSYGDICKITLYDPKIGKVYIAIEQKITAGETVKKNYVDILTSVFKYDVPSSIRKSKLIKIYYKLKTDRPDYAVSDLQEMDENLGLSVLARNNFPPSVDKRSFSKFHIYMYKIVNPFDEKSYYLFQITYNDYRDVLIPHLKEFHCKMIQHMFATENIVNAYYSVDNYNSADFIKNLRPERLNPVDKSTINTELLLKPIFDTNELDKYLRVTIYDVSENEATKALIYFKEDVTMFNTNIAAQTRHWIATKRLLLRLLFNSDTPEIKVEISETEKSQAASNRKCIILDNIILTAPQKAEILELLQNKTDINKEDMTQRIQKSTKNYSCKIIKATGPILITNESSSEHVSPPRAAHNLEKPVTTLTPLQKPKKVLVKTNELSRKLEIVSAVPEEDVSSEDITSSSSTNITSTSSTNITSPSSTNITSMSSNITSTSSTNITSTSLTNITSSSSPNITSLSSQTLMSPLKKCEDPERQLIRKSDRKRILNSKYFDEEDPNLGKNIDKRGRKVKTEEEEEETNLTLEDDTILEVKDRTSLRTYGSSKKKTVSSENFEDFVQANVPVSLDIDPNYSDNTTESISEKEIPSVESNIDNNKLQEVASVNKNIDAVTLKKENVILLNTLKRISSLNKKDESFVKPPKRSSGQLKIDTSLLLTKVPKKKESVSGKIQITADSARSEKENKTSVEKVIPKTSNVKEQLSAPKRVEAKINKPQTSMDNINIKEVSPKEVAKISNPSQQITKKIDPVIQGTAKTVNPANTNQDKLSSEELLFKIAKLKDVDIVRKNKGMTIVPEKIKEATIKSNVDNTANVLSDVKEPVGTSNIDKNKPNEKLDQKRDDTKSPLPKLYKIKRSKKADIRQRAVTSDASENATKATDEKFFQFGADKCDDTTNTTDDIVIELELRISESDDDDDKQTSKKVSSVSEIKHVDTSIFEGKIGLSAAFRGFSSLEQKGNSAILEAVQLKPKSPYRRKVKVATNKRKTRSEANKDKNNSLPTNVKPEYKKSQSPKRKTTVQVLSTDKQQDVKTNYIIDLTEGSEKSVEEPLTRPVKRKIDTSVTADSPTKESPKKKKLIDQHPMVTAQEIPKQKPQETQKTPHDKTLRLFNDERTTIPVEQTVPQTKSRESYGNLFDSIPGDLDKSKGELHWSDLVTVECKMDDENVKITKKSVPAKIVDDTKVEGTEIDKSFFLGLCETAVKAAEITATQTDVQPNGEDAQFAKGKRVTSPSRKKLDITENKETSVLQGEMSSKQSNILPNRENVQVGRDKRGKSPSQKKVDITEIKEIVVPREEISKVQTNVQPNRQNVQLEKPNVSGEEISTIQTNVRPSVQIEKGNSAKRHDSPTQKKIGVTENKEAIVPRKEISKIQANVQPNKQDIQLEKEKTTKRHASPSQNKMAVTENKQSIVSGEEISTIQTNVRPNVQLEKGKSAKRHVSPTQKNVGVTENEDAIVPRKEISKIRTNVQPNRQNVQLEKEKTAKRHSSPSKTKVDVTENKEAIVSRQEIFTIQTNVQPNRQGVPLDKSISSKRHASPSTKKVDVTENKGEILSSEKISTIQTNVQPNRQDVQLEKGKSAKRLASPSTKKVDVTENKGEIASSEKISTIQTNVQPNKQDVQLEKGKSAKRLASPSKNKVDVTEKKETIVSSEEISTIQSNVQPNRQGVPFEKGKSVKRLASPSKKQVDVTENKVENASSEKMSTIQTNVQPNRQEQVQVQLAKGKRATRQSSPEKKSDITENEQTIVGEISTIQTNVQRNLQDVQLTKGKQAKMHASPEKKADVTDEEQVVVLWGNSSTLQTNVQRNVQDLQLKKGKRVKRHSSFSQKKNTTENKEAIILAAETSTMQTNGQPNTQDINLVKGKQAKRHASPEKKADVTEDEQVIVLWGDASTLQTNVQHNVQDLQLAKGKRGRRHSSPSQKKVEITENKETVVLAGESSTIQTNVHPNRQDVQVIKGRTSKRHASPEKKADITENEKDILGEISTMQTNVQPKAQDLAKGKQAKRHASPDKKADVTEDEQVVVLWGNSSTMETNVQSNVQELQLAKGKRVKRHSSPSQKKNITQNKETIVLAGETATIQTNVQPNTQDIHLVKGKQAKRHASPEKKANVTEDEQVIVLWGDASTLQTNVQHNVQDLQLAKGKRGKRHSSPSQKKVEITENKEAIVLARETSTIQTNVQPNRQDVQVIKGSTSKRHASPEKKPDITENEQVILGEISTIQINVQPNVQDIHLAKGKQVKRHASPETKADVSEDEQVIVLWGDASTLQTNVQHNEQDLQLAKGKRGKRHSSPSQKKVEITENKEAIVLAREASTIQTNIQPKRQDVQVIKGRTSKRHASPEKKADITENEKVILGEISTIQTNVQPNIQDIHLAKGKQAKRHASPEKKADVSEDEQVVVFWGDSSTMETNVQHNVQDLQLAKGKRGIRPGPSQKKVGIKENKERIVVAGETSTIQTNVQPNRQDVQVIKGRSSKRHASPEKKADITENEQVIVGEISTIQTNVQPITHDVQLAKGKRVKRHCSPSQKKVDITENKETITLTGGASTIQTNVQPNAQDHLEESKQAKRHARPEKKADITESEQVVVFWGDRSTMQTNVQHNQQDLQLAKGKRGKRYSRSALKKADTTENKEAIVLAGETSREPNVQPNARDHFEERKRATRDGSPEKEPDVPENEQVIVGEISTIQTNVQPIAHDVQLAKGKRVKRHSSPSQKKVDIAENKETITLTGGASTIQTNVQPNAQDHLEDSKQAKRHASPEKKADITESEQVVVLWGDRSTMQTNVQHNEQDLQLAKGKRGKRYSRSALKKADTTENKEAIVLAGETSRETHVQPNARDHFEESKRATRDGSPENLDVPENEQVMIVLWGDTSALQTSVQQKVQDLQLAKGKRGIRQPSQKKVDITENKETVVLAGKTSTIKTNVQPNRQDVQVIKLRTSKRHARPEKEADITENKQVIVGEISTIQTNVQPIAQDVQVAKGKQGKRHASPEKKADIAEDEQVVVLWGDSSTMETNVQRNVQELQLAKGKRVKRHSTRSQKNDITENKETIVLVGETSTIQTNVQPNLLASPEKEADITENEKVVVVWGETSTIQTNLQHNVQDLQLARGTRGKRHALKEAITVNKPKTELGEQTSTTPTDVQPNGQDLVKRKRGKRHADIIESQETIVPEEISTTQTDVQPNGQDVEISKYETPDIQSTPQRVIPLFKPEIEESSIETPTGSSKKDRLIVKIDQTEIDAVLKKLKPVDASRTKYGCKRCSKVFKSLKYLLKHIRHKHLKIGIKCLKCKERFPSYKAIVKHVYRKHEDRRLKSLWCHRCGSSLRSFTSLEEHKRAAHSCPRKKYKCIDCPRRFLTSTLLKIHMLGL